MDVTLDIQTIEAHPEFIDIRRYSLEDMCKVLGIPLNLLVEDSGNQWMRLYSDGSYDVLSSE